MATWARALLACTLAASAFSVFAREDVYGTVEKRPDGKAGTWVINGKPVIVDEKVRLDEEHGQAKVGACVELDYETRNGVQVLEKIEVKRDSTKCMKR